VSIIAQWKTRARQIKTETYALAGAARDPRVPSLARLFAAIAIGYTLSPIDLIPDFIPIIGRLDDALMFGLVVDLLIKSVPSAVLREHLDRVAPMKAA